MTRAIVLLALLVLGSCQMFPRHGTGGFAEHRTTLEPPLYWGNGVVHSGLRMVPLEVADDATIMAGWLDAHLRKVGCTDFVLMGVLQQGARNHFPGMVWQIERQRVRVLRLTASGLEHDAINARNRYQNSVLALQNAMREQADMHGGEATCPDL